MLLNDQTVISFKVGLLFSLLLGLDSSVSADVIFAGNFSVDVARDLELRIRYKFLVLNLIEVRLIGEPELEAFLKEAIEETIFLEHVIQGDL